MHDRATDETRNPWNKRLSARNFVVAAALFATTAVLVAVFTHRAIGQAQAAAKTFTATAMIGIRRENPSVLSVQPSTSSESYTTFVGTQIALIKSAVVLGPALGDVKVRSITIVKAQADPIGWLEELLVVQAVPQSELVKISISLPDPDSCEPLVNAVVKAYLDIFVEREHEQRIARLEKLRKLYQRYQDDLRSKRASIRTLSNQVGSEYRETLELKREMQVRDVHENRQDLRKLRLDLVAAETRLARSKDAKGSNPSEIAALEESVATSKSQVDWLEKQVEMVVANVTRLSNRAIDLQNETDEIALITETSKKIGAEIESLEIELNAPRRITLIQAAVFRVK